MFLHGTYYNQMDERNRIRIPTKLKKILGENPFIMCGRPGALFVISEKEYEKQIEAVFGDTNILDFEKQDLIREFVGGGGFAEEDKQDRIVLSEEQLRHTGIVKNVVTVGAVNQVEIWSEEAWKARHENVNSPENKAYEERIRKYREVCKSVNSADKG